MGKGAIIQLEGPDCSGKTTLAKELMQRATIYNLDAIYFHPHWPKQARRDIPAYYLGTLQAAIRAAASGYVAIIDRCWLSEIVYSTTIRDGLKWPHYKRLFSRLDLRFGVLGVMCLSSDDEKFSERYEGNIDPDHPYSVPDQVLVRSAYQSIYYNELPSLNPALHEIFKPTSLAQEDWCLYDMDTQDVRVRATQLLHRSLAARESLPAWQLDVNLDNWLGSATSAKHLFVLNDVNLPSQQIGHSDYPLFGFNCYYRLMLEALQLIKADERDLAWVDLKNGKAIDLVRLALATNPNLQVVSLDNGDRAFTRSNNPLLLEIPHVNIPCPCQWTSEPAGSVEGYANLLQAVFKG